MIARIIVLLLLLTGSAAAQTNYQPVAPNGLLTRQSASRGQVFNSAGNVVTCFIFNPIAPRNGISTSESIFISLISVASNAGHGFNSIEIRAGNSLVVGPTSQQITWDAVTTGHQIAGYCQ